ncbi:hypothetical protein [Streptomyces sp. R41]|uniref:ABC transporter ATP-binding protein n=1 Tax=Streptomyces sp. R41 TaxID=3238632 RepID=A0AB39RSM2_9ACTN
MTESGSGQSPASESGDALRLSAAGGAASAWITLLTTEHYNLQTARAGTIGEANGRASMFLGAVSAGLIALGFYGHSGRNAGTTIFQVVVLSSVAFLGLVTFVRCLEISIDDWQFCRRITQLRAIYAELVPELADNLRAVAGAEQAIVMLTPSRKPFQRMLSVAGSVGVITSVVIGADAGILVYGLNAPLAAALPVGVATGLLAVYATVRFQSARWKSVEAFLAE